VIRRRIRNGMHAQLDPALPAAVRDGSVLGARRVSPGTDLAAWRVPHHDHLPSQRGRPGRHVRHWGARRDHIRSCSRYALIFIYTTGANILERPEGVKIASVFIAAIIGVSLASRFARSFELRVTEVTFDKTAQLFIRDTARRTIRFLAHEADSRDRAEYSDKLRQVSHDNDLTDPNDVIFVEVTLTDPSEFASRLEV
jgi:hypothetical protein